MYWGVWRGVYEEKKKKPGHKTIRQLDFFFGCVVCTSKVKNMDGGVWAGVYGRGCMGGGVWTGSSNLTRKKSPDQHQGKRLIA